MRLALSLEKPKLGSAGTFKWVKVGAENNCTIKEKVSKEVVCYIDSRRKNYSQKHAAKIEY